MRSTIIVINLNPRKICQNCGREFEFRSKWKECWDDIRYCSEKCRKSYKESRINFWKQEILRHSSLHRAVCASEIAIKSIPSEWKMHLEFVRQAARLLAHEDKILILQGKKIVNPSKFRGEISLKLKNNVKPN